MYIYQNKTPVNEIISGASIAIAAFLLILPGFFTDAFGFFLLIPFTRKIIIKTWINKKNIENFSNKEDSKDIVEAEIIEEKEKRDDEL